MTHYVSLPIIYFCKASYHASKRNTHSQIIIIFNWFSRPTSHQKKKTIRESKKNSASLRKLISKRQGTDLLVINKEVHCIACQASLIQQTKEHRVNPVELRGNSNVNLKEYCN